MNLDELKFERPWKAMDWNFNPACPAENIRVWKRPDDRFYIRLITYPNGIRAGVVTEDWQYIEPLAAQCVLNYLLAEKVPEKLPQLPFEE